MLQESYEKRIITYMFDCRIYDGAMSLGNIRKQIGVIASSFRYIKNNLIQARSENIHLDPVQKTEYEKELRKTQKTLGILKNEIIYVRKLAQKVCVQKRPNINLVYFRISLHASHILMIFLHYRLIRKIISAYQRLSSPSLRETKSPIGL